MTYHLVRKNDELHPPEIGGRVLRIDHNLFGEYYLVEYDSVFLDELRSRAKGLQRDDARFLVLSEQIRAEDLARDAVIRPKWFREKAWTRWPIQPFRLGQTTFEVCSKNPLPSVGNLILQASAMYRVKVKSRKALLKLEEWSVSTSVSCKFDDCEDGFIVQVGSAMDAVTACSFVFSMIGGPSWNGVQWIKNCDNTGAAFDVLLT